MEIKNYKNRIVEKIIDRKLKTTGAVLVTGPKFCGKTTTCEFKSKTKHSFSTKRNIDLYQIDLCNALKGESPILIDEWQNIPSIWDEVRNEIDERGEFGLFIFTGSIEPKNYEEIIHSGQGRFSRVIMYPFSLYESNESSGEISLKDLMDKKDISCFNLNNKTTLNDIAYLICRGGWPTSLDLEKEYSLEVAENCYAGIINYKSKDENNYFDNPNYAEYIIKSLARNISTEAKYTTILADIKNSNNTSLDDETLHKYINKLTKMFVIEDLPAWNPNLRSKTTARVTPTRHFVDTSIACASLGISPNDLLNDLNTFGLFFEDFVIRDLRVYTQALKGKLYHYRDKDGLECDAVIHLQNGEWAAIEIKLGGDKLIKEGLSSLRKVKNKIDYTRFKEPSFLAVITACGPSSKTEDGIYIIPITSLKD